MASHEFYLSLAEIHPAGEIKRLLEELVAQELGHKQRVEFLYTEVAFPQTDGGYELAGTIRKNHSHTG